MNNYRRLFMKNTKKVLSGVLAMAMVASLAACSDDNNNDAVVTTTTAATVEVNTAGFSEEEMAIITSILDELPDTELENKTVKWLGNYHHYPDGLGASKSIALELFEQKYDGVIEEYYIEDFQQLSQKLSDYLMSDEGIDFFVFDESNLPAGISSGKFVPVDDYVDWTLPAWQYVKQGMEMFEFGGKHFMFVTGLESRVQCWYNKKTIEDNGYDDPWELWEAGNWNWDTFKEMLIDFSDPDNDMIGLDNWFYSAALYMSCGVTGVSSKDGHLVNNLKDPTLAKAMDFGYELYQNGCIIDWNKYEWTTQLQKMGDGSELFDITGYWQFTMAPELWEARIDPEYLDVVPVPSPAGSETFAQATPTGFQLCKGTRNPEGVALYSLCNIAAAMDKDAEAISDRQARDDYGWTQDTIDHLKVVHENARLHPVYEIASGVSSQVAGYVTADSNQGVRAPFAGYPWSEQLDTIFIPVDTLVSEADAALQEALADLQ